MKVVKIKTEFIKLDQFLKYSGIISTGSDAKILIFNKDVKVNGEIEEKRGKKLYCEDIIEVNLEKYKIESE